MMVLVFVEAVAIVVAVAMVAAIVVVVVVVVVVLAWQDNCSQNPGITCVGKVCEDTTRLYSKRQDVHRGEDPCSRAWGWC